MFNTLKDQFKTELLKREILPKDVVEVLKKLPACCAGTKESILFLSSSYIEELQQTSDQSELLGKLGFNIDYISYHLLESLIENLFLKNLKEVIDAYKSDLECFRKSTLLIHFSQRKELRLHPEFIEVVTRVEWQDNVKLEYMEQFRREYSSHYKLNKYTMMFAHAKMVFVQATKKKNFLITWYAPKSLTGILQNCDNLPKDDLKRYSVNKLEVAGECVYRAQYRVSFIP